MNKLWLYLEDQKIKMIFTFSIMWRLHINSYMHRSFSYGKLFLFFPLRELCKYFHASIKNPRRYIYIRMKNGMEKTFRYNKIPPFQYEKEEFINPISSRNGNISYMALKSSENHALHFFLRYMGSEGGFPPGPVGLANSFKWRST